jgi:hypothetical protein
MSLEQVKIVSIPVTDQDRARRRSDSPPLGAALRRSTSQFFGVIRLITGFRADEHSANNDP